MTTHEEHMRRAVALSRVKMLEGEGGPFAALVARDGEVLGEGWNRVTSDNDPTAHAEIVAIRAACEALGTFSLERAVLYTTCEPCPMCLAAAYWARISRIYYANATEDADAIGFDDGLIYDELCRAPEARSIPSERIPSKEALSVFAEWRARPDRIRY